MPSIAELRRMRPRLADLSDDEVLDLVASDYPDVPRDKIARDLGVSSVPPPAEGRTVGGTVKDLGLSALKSAVAVPEMAVGAADMVTGGRVGKALAEGVAIPGSDAYLEFDAKKARQVLDEHYSDAQKAANREVEQAQGFFPTLNAAVHNPSTIAHSVVESLAPMAVGGLGGRALLGVGGRVMAADAAAAGSMGPYVVPGVLTRALGGAAPTLAGALGEGATMAAQDAEQIRQDTPDGLLTPGQSLTALAIGAGGAGFALLGGRVARKLGIHDIDTAIAAGHMNEQAGKGLVRRVLEGALSEGLLEELPQSVMEQVLQNAATDKPLDEGVDHAAVMGMLAGAAMGGGANIPGGHAQAAPGPLARASGNPAANPTPAAPDAPEAAQKLKEAVATLVADEKTNRPDPDQMLDKMHRQAERDAQSQREWDSSGGPVDIEDGDILHTNGQPFKNKAAARKAAGDQKGGIYPVDGGFVFRPIAVGGAENASNPAASPSVEQAPGQQQDVDKSPPAADGDDGLYAKAVEAVRADGRGSVSRVQRAMGIGFNKAASLLERMEREGIVSPMDAKGARTVLKSPEAQAIDEAAHQAATSPRNDLPEPTQAQKEAGNYTKGHVQWQGLDVTIENPQGSTRSGTGPDGKPWSHQMSDHYGYIRRTKGADNEQVDLYLGPKHDASHVFVVDQIHQDSGMFDEHKVMAGYPSQEAAIEAYKANFDKGWEVGPVTPMTVDGFKQWLDTGNLKKPVAGVGKARQVPAETQQPQQPQRETKQPAAAPAAIEPITEGASDESTNTAPAADAGRGPAAGKDAADAAGRGDVRGSVAQGDAAAHPESAPAGRADAADDAGAAGQRPGNGVAATEKPLNARKERTAVEAAQEEWWDKHLTSAGRSDIMKANRVNLPARVKWMHMSPENRAKVDHMRPSAFRPENAPAPAPASPVVDKRQRRAQIRAAWDAAESTKQRRDWLHAAGITDPAQQSGMVKGAWNDLTDAAKAALQKVIEPVAPAAPAQQNAAASNSIVAAPSQGEGSQQASATPPTAPSAKAPSADDTTSGKADNPQPAGKPAETAPNGPKVSANTIFTEDAAAKAREILRKKLGTLNSGIDPEILQAGITLAGYHIERGARTFAAYAQAMVADLGEAIRPYLKSFYMAVKYDPRAAAWEGMDDAATVDKADTRSPLVATVQDGKDRVTFADHARAEAAAGEGTLTRHFLKQIEEGNMPRDNPALRRMLEAYLGREAGQIDMKEAQERLEAAIAMRARILASMHRGSVRTGFDAMLALYESQPNLNVRTSTSVENQAYSTPAPLAYLASRLADVRKGESVLEPTAGTGMLLMEATVAKADANELNELRRELLAEQGFRVSGKDAATENLRHVGYPVDVVLANPPFGSLKDEQGRTRKQAVDGYKLGQIDHLIAARALATMKDDGRATLIIGANKVPGGQSEDDRIFFNWLYSHYKVHTHFEVDGKLYARQGAAWPVRVISIEGRKAAPDNAVAPAAGTIQRVDTWEKVYEQYEQSVAARGAAERDATPAAGRPDGGKTGAAAVSGPAGEQAPGAGGRGPRSSAPGSGTVAGAGTGAVGDRRGGESERVGDEAGEQRGNAPDAGADRLEQAGEPAAAEPGRRDRPADRERNAGVDAENQFQAKYVPRSSRKDEGILIPVNMAQPLQDALDTLEDAVGDIDEYARRELGYKTADEMHQALMGLQVDSVASAIYQMSRGKGLIIADQTGIGKGRQAASIIRWAVKNKKVPVFVTVKPALFTDMHVEDLRAIGADKMVQPFIMNVGEEIKDHDGTLLFSTSPADRRRAIAAMTGGEMPQGKNAVFMTYSQINVENAQRGAIQGIAPNAVFILDESHNAGGDSATGEFIKGVLDLGQGTVYLSATYAKRPDNMPLYFKTDMGEAVADDNTLMDAMAAGGLPLQTVVSNNLVKAGQMFRRERSYDGVDIRTTVDTERRAEHEALSDETTKALRAIVAADRFFHTTFIKELQEQLREEGGSALDMAGNQAERSVDHTQFSSVVHNFVRQMLLGLNAQNAANAAVTALKDGKKPLIALENTMGSFLSEYAANNSLRPGQPLGDFSYRTVLSRALERTRYYVEKDRQGNKNKVYVPLAQLSGPARAMYEQAQHLIDTLDIPIPVSPIDWMRAELQRAGYSVAEITGRDLRVDYTDPKKPVLEQVDQQEQDDKTATTRRFNGISGKPLDAIILNVAGSTGISLHASEKFTDQRKRKMIVAQAAQDINIFMQMLGRIHRTGQVELPEYEILNPDLPAVRRPTALLSKKMKSLNANTSSNTESATSVEAVDMLNKYGDEVVAQYLSDNPELSRALGIDSPTTEEGKPSEEDIARKATGRLALMPVPIQKQFYEEVEEQYRTLIDYLNRTNQNELEPRTYDFDAKELKSETIFSGTNPDSPFGQDATYGEYSVKAQGKPMTPDEIKAEIAEHLGGKTPEAHMRAIHHVLDGGFDAFRQTLVAAPELQERADRIRSQAIDFLEQHAIGRYFRVDINGDSYNAVVTNLRTTHKKGGNPYSLSKIQLTLALNGALRHVTLPATKMQSIEVSTLGANYRVEQLFQAKADDRETAKIITGNLLGAYGELQGTRGTIISFTKADGSVEQGILLPKQFQMADNTKGGYRLASGADALRFLHEADEPNLSNFGISTRDQVVRVLPNGSRGITIRVPKSKAKGGRYFLDRELRAAVGDFVTVGDRMVASTTDAAAATRALDVIMKKQALYVLDSMKDTAQVMFAHSIKFGKDGKPELRQGGKPMFRQDEGTSTLPANAKQVSELQAAVDSIREGWKRAPEVTVTPSVASAAVPKAIRDEARKLIANGGSVPSGVFYNGEVWLFADRISNTDHAAEVVFHEVLGHMGLRGVFGEHLAPILRQIAAARPAEIAAIIRRNGFKPEERLRAAEEFLAEMAQKNPQLGFVQRAIAAIRTFLRGIPGLRALAGRLSDAEIIRSYILPARAWIEGGGSANVAPSAMFSAGPQPFYSPLSRGLSALPDKALARVGWEGAINALVNKGKVKADEVEWSGVRDWLAMQEGKVTKDALLEFLANNGVHVREVVKGGGTAETKALDDARVRLDALGFTMRQRGDGGELVITRRSDGARFMYDENEDAFVMDGAAGEDSEDIPTLEGEADQWARVAHNAANDDYDSDEQDTDGTKYGKYTLPGGENYREVLLTLPEKPKQIQATPEQRAYFEHMDRMREQYGNLWRQKAPVEDRLLAGKLEAAANVGNIRKDVANYHSNHWSEPNVIAHIRVNDRTDPDGKRVLFVEEIQSDWAQQGRRKDGFYDPAKPWHLIDPREKTGNFGEFATEQEAKEAGARMGLKSFDWIDMRKEGVPRGPFVEKTDAWLNLALKRIVTMAAQGGYDRVAFVNGEQSADRYSLSHVVDRLSWFPAQTPNDGRRTVMLDLRGGRTAALQVAADGTVTKGTGELRADGKPLADVIGKAAAEKIMAAGRGELAGDGLRFGGEGMMTFYDKIVPAAVNKLLPKLGGEKLGEVEMRHGLWQVRSGSRTVNVGTGRAAAEDVNQNEFRGRGEVRQAESLTQPGFDVTPAMREHAKDGLPLFAQGSGRPEAEIVSSIVYGTTEWRVFDDLVEQFRMTQQPDGSYIKKLRVPADALSEETLAMVERELNLEIFDDDVLTLRHKAHELGKESVYVSLAPRGSLPTFSQAPFSQAQAGVNNPADFMNRARGIVDELAHSPGKLNWWQKRLGTPYDLAQRHPKTFGRVYERVQQFLRDVSLYATEAADLAPQILPKLDTWRDAFKAPLSAADTKAIQAPIFEGTVMWERDADGKPVKVREDHDEGVAQGIVWKDSELRELFNLTPEQIALYRQVRAAIDKSLTNLVLADTLRYAGKDGRPVADAVMESDDLKEGAETLAQYLESLAEADPERADELNATATKVRAKATRGRHLIEHGYAPLSRFGTHTVDVMDADGKRVFFGLFENRWEARRAAAKMRGLFPGATITRGTTSQEEYKLFAGVSPETVELFGELLGLEADGAAAQDQAFQTFLKEARSSRSAMKRLIHRKGITGYSEDVGRVLAGFIYSNARQTSNNLHAKEIGEAAAQIPQGQGEIKDAAVRLMRYTMEPQEEAIGLRGVLFAQYLGGSFAAMLVNMTQPYAVTMPYLTQWAKVGRVGALMAGATRDVWKDTTGDKALDEALKLAAERGIVAPQEVHQLMKQAQGKASLLASDGTMLGRAQAMVGNTFSRAALLWGQPFAVAELFNRRLTFIAAYRLALEQGMKDPAAFAEKAINDTQFVYNKGNKPEWARGAVGSVLFTFKQYSISYLELAHRMATQGGPEGKKAAALMLMMLLLMGGAGGLPFADDLGDAIDGLGQRLGYNTRFKHWRQEFLQRMLGETLGNFVDKGVTGIPGMPIDLSARFGMGNLIPGTGLLTKKKDHTSDVVEVLGPAGDLATRAFQGANMAADGKPVTGALQMSPAASRNLQKAYLMATQGFYPDQGGKKVIDTDAWDAFVKAIGFQPRAVAQTQEASRDVQQMKDVVQMKESEIADKWAKAVFEKDPEAAKSAQAELQAWNRDNPESPIRIQQRQIRQRVRNMRQSKAERLAATSPKEIRAEVRRELKQGGR